MADYLPLAERKNDPDDCRRAKDLRKASPLAERLLWNELRKLPKNIGLKFRRQHPIHPYIADFACLKSRLIVELDGESHNLRQDYDIQREDFLTQAGYMILGFTNEDVCRNCEGVVQKILDTAKKQAIIVPLP